MEPAAALAPPGLTAVRFRFASRAAAFEVGLIALGFVVLWFFLPHWPWGDDWIRLNDIRQLIDNGHLTNSPFSLAGPLLSAPFIEIAEQFGTPWYVADHLNVAVTAVGVVAATDRERPGCALRVIRQSIMRGHRVRHVSDTRRVSRR